MGLTANHQIAIQPRKGITIAYATHAIQKKWGFFLRQPYDRQVNFGVIIHLQSTAVSHAECHQLLAGIEDGT